MTRSRKEKPSAGAGEYPSAMKVAAPKGASSSRAAASTYISEASTTLYGMPLVWVLRASTPEG
eukprot:5006426-Pleurochrysis_carterae.AAC.1